ncbi:16S rRNA (guanine(966)-N(2))-methyltransferase RsmD [Undibacterium sp. Jales W-56]|uniref:16S rRNA (guanine(966)-N(2))-methyltransferase RsmD n=1 Tax=Undibacterium sp. Jales W-56 TaxID=2897325 RepID=UPI0021D10EC2|nr:16S rRNA (guanine(966)-N(2))-methyltransferase RsmD [Undibacterium sp. Jales W-56]MCU6435049.1 16S rRNA (guanine(966)-N(2))-methyltransferase RsmD [Undibacterium sp. Jales W-56]
MKAQARKPHAPQTAPKRVPHQVRIIGGLWKRSVLSVIDAEGLRPTPDRVRETVFNWLTHLTDGRWSALTCLDLFAGTGALGFEVASRGAAGVTMVEYHTPAFKQLDQVRQKLNASQVNLLRGDALTIVQSMVARQQQYDLIFLDPPFEQAYLPKILPYCAKLLAAGGLVYVEAEYALPTEPLMQAMPDWLADWKVIRADQAGSVYFHILQRNIMTHEALGNQA